jgi:hypothetical protein
LKRFVEDGYQPEQVAVVSFHGVKNSEALRQETLGGYKTKRFSGYDASGNALWTRVLCWWRVFTALRGKVCLWWFCVR